MAHLSTPLVFPLGGDLVTFPNFIESISIVAQDTIAINFMGDMAVTSENIKISNYTVTPLDGGIPVTGIRVLLNSGPANSIIYLKISQPSLGALYSVTVNNLTTIDGAVLSGNTSSGEFIPRITKLDNMISSRKSLFDLSSGSIIREMLTAFALEDDLIGGSRKDRLP